MAVQQPVPPVPNPAGAPAYAAVGSADTIPVVPGGKYLLIVKNAGGSADLVEVLDQVTTNPVGAKTAGDFRISISVPATTGERHFFLDAGRFRDASGNINVTHGFTTTVTCIVYGPF